MSYEKPLTTRRFPRTALGSLGRPQILVAVAAGVARDIGLPEEVVRVQSSFHQELGAVGTHLVSQQPTWPQTSGASGQKLEEEAKL